MLDGKVGEGQQVGLGVDEELGDGWELALELVETRANWACTWVTSDWAKTVRTRVATMAWAALGTRVNRLRMAWVRQRCQEAPGSTAAMASSALRGRRR